MKTQFILVIILGLILFTPISFGMNFSSKTDDSIINNPVLFLHNSGNTGSSWAKMITFLNNSGLQRSLLFAYTFTNPNSCGDTFNLKQARQVVSWVDSILNQTRAKKVDLVGIGMGDIIGRYYIKFLNGSNKVDDFVSLGGPNHGTNPQRPDCYLPTDPLILKLNDGDETPEGILSDSIGQRNDTYGNIFQGTHIPGNINYTSIFSRYDGVIPYKSAPLEGANNIYLNNQSNRINHEDFYSNVEVFHSVENALIYIPANSQVTISSNTLDSGSNSVPGFEIISLAGISLVYLKKKKFV